ncbi:MAG: hypothetical protein QY322_00305 [bacterium]|nr:MAG: hypothetical protein QY322_00305 [bacterium]
MKKLIIFSSLFVLFLASVVFYLKLTSTPVFFNSRIGSLRIENKNPIILDIYLNFSLKLNKFLIKGIKPKSIAIVYTDKVRPSYQYIDDNQKIDFGSTIDILSLNEVLIYIYVSENVLRSSDAEHQIKEYTLNVIQFYQGKEEVTQQNQFNNFFKLPIYVKNI